MGVERLIVGCRQQSASLRLLSEYGEEFPRHQLHQRPLARSGRRTAADPHVHGCRVDERRQLRPALQLPTGVLELRPREPWASLTRADLLSRQELLWIGHRQVAQKHGIHHREHRCRTADADRQRRDRDQTEERAARQHAKAVSQVSKQVVEQSGKSHDGGSATRGPCRLHENAGLLG